MRKMILVLAAVALACNAPEVGKEYESREDGTRWTSTFVFTGEEAEIACRNKRANVCIRLTQSGEVGARYVTSAQLRRAYMRIFD